MILNDDVHRSRNLEVEESLATRGVVKYGNVIMWSKQCWLVVSTILAIFFLHIKG